MHNRHPDYVTDPDPEGTASLFLVFLGIAVCAVGALVFGLLAIAGPETATDPQPEPSPSSSSTWSPECTAEDLDDGACYTWDDIRDLEWHSQSPTPGVG